MERQGLVRTSGLERWQKGAILVGGSLALLITLRACGDGGDSDPDPAPSHDTAVETTTSTTVFAGAAPEAGTLNCNTTVYAGEGPWQVAQRCLPGASTEQVNRLSDAICDTYGTPLYVNEVIVVSVSPDQDVDNCGGTGDSTGPGQCEWDWYPADPTKGC